MNEKEKLKRAEEFIKAFRVREDDEYLYTHDGHNSVVMRTGGEWGDFAGHSIRGVAEWVAKEKGKKIKHDYR